MEPLGDRMDHGSAHAAADAKSPPARDQLRGHAERPGDVLESVARLERHEFARALAHGLDDQGNRARFRAGVGDGQRDAFGSGRPAHNDELTRAPDLRDARSGDIKAGYVRAQLPASGDLMHFWAETILKAAECMVRLRRNPSQF